MPDVATPNLPSRDFGVTSQFYGELGFAETWRDAGWMILKRGDLILEFFSYPDFDPASSSFGSCVRMEDVAPLFEAIIAAGVPEATTGRPRAHRPKLESWGGLVGAMVDPDGNLIRLVQVPG